MNFPGLGGVFIVITTVAAEVRPVRPGKMKINKEDKMKIK